MPEMIRLGSSQPWRNGKGSVLRQMAALAEDRGLVCDPESLLQGLEAREELCSTGIPGGLALLHSRNPESYLLKAAFLALGRTIQQIPFGSPDGRATDLFFLIGCPDERMHLHTAGPLVSNGAKDGFTPRTAPSSGMPGHLRLHPELRTNGPGQPVYIGLINATPMAGRKLDKSFGSLTVKTDKLL